MWSKLMAVWPGAAARRRVLQAGVVAAVAVGAFCWGRHGDTNPASAQQQPGRGAFAPGGPAPSADYSRRVVAFIYGNVPVTREELGEYLIARFGAERVEFLVNRRIIERACEAKGIAVTDAEVDAGVAEDLKAMGVSHKDFVEKILKRYNKSLYEYREDVVRPKLAMQRLCRDSVVVNEDDLRKAFEARYGEKVKCRMIVLQKEVGRQAADIWAKVRSSEEEFDKAAMSQFIPELASKKGHVPPIHRHFPDAMIEKVAFGLKSPGDVSELLSMPDGTSVILKLVGREPANLMAKLDDVRGSLHKEVYDAKLALTIPQTFAKLREAAGPQIILKREPATHEYDRHARETMPQFPAMNVPPAAAAPRGN